MLMFQIRSGGNPSLADREQLNLINVVWWWHHATSSHHVTELSISKCDLFFPFRAGFATITTASWLGNNILQVEIKKKCKNHSDTNWSSVTVRGGWTSFIVSHRYLDCTALLITSQYNIHAGCDPSILDGYRQSVVSVFQFPPPTSPTTSLSNISYQQNERALH